MVIKVFVCPECGEIAVKPKGYSWSTWNNRKVHFCNRECYFVYHSKHSIKNIKAFEEGKRVGAKEVLNKMKKCATITGFFNLIDDLEKELV